ISENAAYHLYHSFGIVTNLTKRKEPAPVVVPAPVVEPPKDRDGDGVLDSLDKCPDTKGLASLQGCPDRDGDGIADGDDKCPDTKGLARYQGCPIPDTDKDGINDEEDKCPTVFGVARYQGCPVPDTDGDGVNDEEDKCKNEKGPASNFGCPVIDAKIVERVNKAAQNVFFATGSAKLLAKSFPKLNDVVTILKENPTYNVNIDGHTDNTGKADKNQTLSESRAASVKAYLVSKGIDESRLTSTGYGQDKPVADNKTAAGRAKNRRVEMSVRNY
ncbi:MAG TPA: OmpA family protein, partial [Ferruginibacter sp.]|nr:OmpA family protein [Ferruginibacter sp.]